MKCKLCNNEFKRITSSHLKKDHKITSTEYLELFPDEILISQETKDKISAGTKGKEKQKEHKEKMSKIMKAKAESGELKTNKGKKFKTWDERGIREKIIQARLNRNYRHSEETKQKISDSLRKTYFKNEE